MPLICAILLLTIAYPAPAQVNSSARFSGMGNTGAALGGHDALTNNQAGIVDVERITAALYHQEHFFSTDVSTDGLIAVIPSRLTHVGLHLRNYGIPSVYSDLKAGFSMAKAFGPQLALALTLNYHQLQINQYGSSRTVSGEVGLQYRVNGLWALGAHLANPGNAAFSREANAPVPAHLRLGSSLRFSSKLLFTTDFEQQLHYSRFNVRIGLEYLPLNWISLRSGLQLHELKHFCGFGLLLNQIQLDMSAVIHPHLGIAPQIALAYAF